MNVTSQLADDVFLHCRVNDLREKMVSFVLLYSVHFLIMLRASSNYCKLKFSSYEHSSHLSSQCEVRTTVA